MRYFDISEFDSPDFPGSGEKMDKTFLKMIDRARRKAGIPFIINSGYRTPFHNRQINGSETSSHLKGNGGDIECDDSVSRLRIIQGLIYAGFTRIGIADNFIHADNDPDKPDCIWLYQKYIA